MFDSLQLNNPFLQTNSLPMSGFANADSASFASPYANLFANPNAGFSGGTADFSAFLSPFGNPQTSFGGNDFMNSAFGAATPWSNPFSASAGGGISPFADMMSAMFGNPYTKMESGCGTYVIDPKKAESQFSPMIEKYAKQYGIRADVAKALIKQESRFNPNAVSKAGAKGLTQLMPGTARDMGITNPFDPEQSVRGGLKYLSILLKRYNGDYRKAVAAYNGGMGNIDKKGINFCKETANYHRAVLG